ncbi:UvrD-helicase domain-containing protein [Emticicia sp. SJ17W-69]|uniref:UvrD-helicase domain-containing protein n=1 Tax=Emticicia sp. SJ17W-69 TaxID=3421657 RepID=UPI003EBC9120
MENLKIVIAGAGAGKTHNLKEEVVKCLPELDACRTCAVITFTNAATEELRKRISQEVKLMPNIYIGTIHSFLIQYVLNPYGKVLNLMPEDKIYVDGINSNWSDKPFRIAKANEWEQKGVLVFDKVLELAERILENESVFNLLLNKIQFLFIDEYQDNRLKIHLLWKKIIEARKTKVYLIGDPLQCIFKFSYDLTHIDPEQVPESFDKTPLNDLKINHSHSVVSTNINYRSRKTIVDFANHFILEEEYKQTTENLACDIPIYFIEEKEIKCLIDKYRKLKKKHSLHDLHSKRKKDLRKDFFADLILTRNWIDNKPQKPIYNIYLMIKSKVSRLEKGESKLTSPLKELERCILAIIGIKKTEFIKDIYDEIEFRKFCLEIFEVIKECNEKRKFIVESFNSKFGIEAKNETEINQDRSLNDIFTTEMNCKTSNTESFFSTIHSSKGLEATSVLLIAENNQELSEWLDFEKANSQLDDKYRLGYVAFTRARDMLVIGCLEDINEANKQKLSNLGVELLSKE